MKTRLKDVRGRLVAKHTSKYLVDWEKKRASNIQFEVKKFLKTYWLSCQVFEEFPVYGTRMRIDLLNLTYNIAVEVNGPQHRKFNKFFHGGSLNKYREGLHRDAQKAKWLEINHIKLIEIEDREIKKLSPEWILETFGVEI